MRFTDTRLAGRGLAWGLALLLACGPALLDVRAQEGGPASIAAAGEPVLLRETPGFDAAVMTQLGDGSAVEVVGGPEVAADGTTWLPVVSGGQSGYVPAGYVVSGGVPAAAPAPEAIPVEAASVEGVSPAPEAVPAPEPVAAAPLASGATTTTETNVRAWPAVDADILAVLPPNTPLSVDGPAENGFVPVSGSGGSGWIAAELLSGGAAPAPIPDPVEMAPAPNTVPNEPPPLVAGDPATATNPPAVEPAPPAPVVAPDQPPAAEPAPVAAAPSNESTGIIWPFSGGEWNVVQGYNNGTHTNRGGFAQYKYSLDWAKSDGKTAGEPVYAPVSGAIQWTDRGSGGILIDAGNGYGVALFHVTLERGVARGGSVQQGERIGTISGPGGDGFMSMEHIEIAAWRLKNGGGHESVPFTGPNTIAGQEFPDDGGANQHMGATVSP